MEEQWDTGETLAASVAPLRKAGANVVAGSFVVEQTALGGREGLDIPVKTLLSYED